MSFFKNKLLISIILLVSNQLIYSKKTKSIDKTTDELAKSINGHTESFNPISNLSNLGLDKGQIDYLENKSKNEIINKNGNLFDKAVKYANTFLSKQSDANIRVDAFSKFIDSLGYSGTELATEKAGTFLKILNSSNFKEANRNNSLFTVKDLINVIDKSKFSVGDLERYQVLLNVPILNIPKDDIEHYKILSDALSAQIKDIDFAYSFQNADVDGMISALLRLEPYKDKLNFINKIDEYRKIIKNRKNNKTLEERDQAFISYINLINDELIKYNLTTQQDSLFIKNTTYEYLKNKRSDWTKPFFDAHTEVQIKDLKNRLLDTQQ